MSFNKIIIVGNLGSDPELRYTPQGTAVTTFSLATNEKRKDKDGERKDETTWFRVTLWNKAAENASRYLTKGSSVYIEGRLRVESWVDRDSKNRYTLEVSATEMQFLATDNRPVSRDMPPFGRIDAPEPTVETPSPLAKAFGTDTDIPF